MRVNEKRLSKGTVKKWNDAVLILLIAYIFYGAGSMVSEKLRIISDSSSFSPEIKCMIRYLRYLLMGIPFLIYMVNTESDRILMKKFFTGQKKSALAFFAGIGLGGAANGICLFAAAKNANVLFTFNSFEPLLMFAAFLAVFIQAGTEEIICRIFIQQNLIEKYGLILAVFLSSSFFVLMHLKVPEVGFTYWINVFIAGIVFSLSVCFSNSFWMAAGMHAMWNYMQSFGFYLPHSGYQVPFFVFSAESVPDVASFFFSSVTGVEGTWFSSIVLTAIAGFLFVAGKKRGRFIRYNQRVLNKESK